MITGGQSGGVLVWTRSAPDRPSGSPAILADYLQLMPRGSADIVCERGASQAARRDLALAHPITRIAPEQALWPFRRGARIRRLLRYAAVPLYLAYGLLRIRRGRPACILTIYFDTVWILTSYLLSRLTGTPLVYYVHDPFLEVAAHRGGIEAVVARWLEPRSLRLARVAVLYPSLQRHYRQRYGIESVVVRHAAVGARSPRRSTARRTPVRIGFAGTIYDNNRALLSALGRACARVGGIEVELLTNASSAALRELGLDARHVRASFEANHEALLGKLAECDLLYLPLGFGDTPQLPRISLSVVLPTKAVDYLLSGPPILVHCPEDYETAEFFRSHRAGYLLTSDAPGALEQWLERWLSGGLPALCEADVQRAADEFSPRRNFEAFTTVLPSTVALHAVQGTS